MALGASRLARGLAHESVYMEDYPVGFLEVNGSLAVSRQDVRNTIKRAPYRLGAKLVTIFLRHALVPVCAGLPDRDVIWTLDLLLFWWLRRASGGGCAVRRFWRRRLAYGGVCWRYIAGLCRSGRAGSGWPSDATRIRSDWFCDGWLLNRSTLLQFLVEHLELQRREIVEMFLAGDGFRERLEVGVVVPRDVLAVGKRVDVGYGGGFRTC